MLHNLRRISLVGGGWMSSRNANNRPNFKNPGVRVDGAKKGGRVGAAGYLFAQHTYTMKKIDTGGVFI